MRELFRDLIMPSKRQIITFVIFLSPAEAKQGAGCEFDLFLKKLVKKEFEGLTRHSYELYFTDKGIVCIQANNFKTRMDILLSGS